MSAQPTYFYCRRIVATNTLDCCNDTQPWCTGVIVGGSWECQTPQPPLTCSYNPSNGKWEKFQCTEYSYSDDGCNNPI